MLRQAGVDFINTDRLEALAKFLRAGNPVIPFIHALMLCYSTWMNRIGRMK